MSCLRLSRMLCFRWNRDEFRVTMRIRMAKTSDLPGAVQLWFERISFLRESDASIVLAPDARILWRQQAMKWIDDDESAFFVAEVDSALAGLLVVRTKDNPAWFLPRRMGELVEIVLDLHRPHRGLSSALVERAAAWLRIQDINILEVEPNAYDPVAEAFWRAQSGRLRSRRFWLKL